jgi:dolichyl-phosphate beta-glucosyltransferase
VSDLHYSIIIPAYNESERIVATLDRVLAYVAQQQWETEILVVNDGSRDNTAAIIRGYADQHAHVRLLENPGNRGKGYAVRNGMMNARGDVLLFSDADLSAPIEEAPKLFAAIAAGADCAIGSRWLRPELQSERQPLHRQLFGRIYNLLLRMLLGLHFADTQCGFKAFTRRSAAQIFPRMKIDRWGFDSELLFLARKSRQKIVEVPVRWAHDERSKISPVRDGIKMFWEMCRIRWYSLSGKYSQTPAAVPATEP